MDWELQQELEDFRRETEWEASLPDVAKCSECGMTDNKFNMCSTGWGDNWLCTECELEAEEEDY